MEGRGRLRRPRRTSGWLWSSRGGLEMGCRWRAAAIGARLRRRGSSRGGWARRRGWGAAIGRGTANGVLSEGGEAAEGRVDGGVSLSEFTRCGGSVLRVRGRERARGRVDCDAGSPGVLRRAQDVIQGCCSARATAAARWQPRGGSGRRGDGRGHQREGVVGPEARGGAT